MAQKKTKPVVELTPDMKKRLEVLGEDLDRADEAVKLMKNLGMDVKEIEEKNAWSRQVRDTLLANFV